jgi:murein DD-endopeptidase MepM/ murein hydrolase activator NlpD
MRATSPPIALPVAAAALALIAAVLASLAVPSAALAERWLRPVPGEVARPFGYSRAAPFARGAHRGADLTARPGAAVRSACPGRVVHAGAVAAPALVVSVRCGGRRVSYLPLATVAVRAGDQVRAGTRLGTLAAGHGGLHLGVRREADPFGYEDPAALLPPRAPRQPPTLTPADRRDRPASAPRPAPRPALRAHAPSSMPVFAPATTPRIATWPRAPRIATWPRAPAGHAAAALAPWPVWLGVAALLTGAVGSASIGARRRGARRQRTRAAPSLQAR